jgi:hypothetical protein
MVARCCRRWDAGGTETRLEQRDGICSGPSATCSLTFSRPSMATSRRSGSRHFEVLPWIYTAEAEARMRELVHERL